MIILLIKQDHFIEGKWVERENEDKQLLWGMECSQESGRKEDSKAEARKISRNEKAKNRTLRQILTFSSSQFPHR